MTPDEITAAIGRGDLSPGCGNPSCPCRTRPWERACDEWAGGDRDPLPFCPQCGWAEHLHTTPNGDPT